MPTWFFLQNIHFLGKFFKPNFKKVNFLLPANYGFLVVNQFRVNDLEKLRRLCKILSGYMSRCPMRAGKAEG